MISYLKGTVIFKDSDYIILETNGIGYKVFMPDVVIMQLREGQADMEVFCSLQIRKEETIELYGFPSPESLKLFGAFKGVSGIGPKAAMLLASLGKPDVIKRAIDQRNTEYFRGVKGLGEKKIQKLILELTGKLGDFGEKKTASSGDEVVDSLVALGFTKIEAKEALSRLPSEVTDPEQKVKAALKLLARQ